MASLAVARWLVTSTGRTPLAWAAWLFVASLGPLWQAAAPLGIGSGSSRLHGPTYEVAFIGALLGAVLALRALERGQWLVATLAHPERFLGEALGVPLLVTAFAAPAFLALPVLDDGGPGLAPLATITHLSALTLLVARVPTSTGPRAALLVALVWWIPAALAGGGGVAQGLAALLDVPGRLASPGSPVETPFVALADLAPTGAATIAAWLLDPPAPSRR